MTELTIAGAIVLFVAGVLYGSSMPSDRTDNIGRIFGSCAAAAVGLILLFVKRL